MKILLLLAIGSSIGAYAEEPAKPIPVHYELRNLKPVSMSQYDTPETGMNRQYLRFENEQGTHFLVYEELNNAPPLALGSLKQVMGSWNSTCSMDIDCTTKAFCTGDCRNMYYEITNATTLAPDRNRCQIRYHSCEHVETTAIPGPTPSPAPAAVVAAPAAPSTPGAK